MTELVVTWRREPGGVTFVVDGQPVGRDDPGLESLLARVRRAGTPVVVVVPELGTGSASLREQLPFGSRLTELEQAAGGAEHVGYRFG